MDSVEVSCVDCWEVLGTVVAVSPKGAEVAQAVMELMIDAHVGDAHPGHHPVITLLHDDGSSSYIVPELTRGLMPI